ncbi:MAG TPA: hypothetical protein VNU21_02890 [Usitatibacter sp.]|nr:hypothetical protein [Usitatibacter sp.]
MTRHFLYLTNSRLVSLVTRRASIVARREFAVSGAGVEQFERHLAELADVPTYLFTDLSEEDFRLDTIPHVGARDRQAVVTRKLSQIFRNTPFRYAHMQGREAEGRRDDRVIYTAITNPEVMRPWLDVMERLKVPLEGIHSTAVFSAVMLEELDLVFPHTLLVTFTPGDAMRQSYFRDREIKFSRLTPLDVVEGQTLGSMVAEETTRTWQYLDSLRHFTPEDRLEVCILVHENDRPSVQASLRDFAQIQYRLLDMGDVARKLGLKPPPLGSSAEEVLVHLFLMRPAPNHFASPEQRRHATLRRTRRGVVKTSLAIMAASLLWGGFTAWRVTQATSADDKLENQIAALNREYDKVSREMPSFGVGGSTMRDTVTFYDSAIRAFPTLSDFVRPISAVLQAHPNIRLRQLAWQATDDPKAIPALQPNASLQTPPVKAVPHAEGSAAPAAPSKVEEANPPFATGRYEVALLEATVRVGRDDFRVAVDTVETLARQISTVRSFSAEIVESPLDVRSSYGLEGRYGDKQSDSMDLHFVLRVVRDHGAGA